MFTFIRWFTFYAESLTGGLFLWLGLYILSRGYPIGVKSNDLVWWRRSTFAAGCSFVLASWFIFGIALRSIVTTERETIFWLRVTWWATPLALIFWLRAVWLMPQQGKVGQMSQAMRWVLWVGAAAAASLALLGFFDGGVFHYSGIVSTGATWTDYYYIHPVVPRYYLFVTLLLLVLLSTAGHLYWRYRQSVPSSHEQAEFRLLAVGTFIFIVGAGIGVISSLTGRNDWQEHVGYAIATVGILFLGRGVVRYNALIEQQIVRQDFGRSLRGSFAAAFIFLFIFNLIFAAIAQPLPPVVVPLLIYLSLFMTTPLRWMISWVDWWTLPPWQAQFMWRLTEVRQQVLMSPNKQEALQLALEQLRQSTQEAQLGQIREMIAAEVAAIFHHSGFRQDGVMARSQLLELCQVKPALKTYCQEHSLLPNLLTDREKARFLQGYLAQFMQEKFRPSPSPEKHSPRTIDDHEIEFLLLHKSYVEGKIRMEVIQEIEEESGFRLAGSGTGGRVYAQFLQNGRERLAELLWHQELRFYHA